MKRYNTPPTALMSSTRYNARGGRRKNDDTIPSTQTKRGNAVGYLPLGYHCGAIATSVGWPISHTAYLRSHKDCGRKRHDSDEYFVVSLQREGWTRANTDLLTRHEIRPFRHCLDATTRNTLTQRSLPDSSSCQWDITTIENVHLFLG